MVRSTPSCAAASGTGPRRIRNWQAASPTDHFVQFYRTDEYLIECLAEFVADGLWNRETAVIIATAEHRLSLEQRLRLKGVDLVTATMRQQFLAFDAREMLAKFMVEGRPQRNAFRAAVGSLLAQVSASGKRVRAFGEMVGLLWMEGRREAAIELENLWNELSREREFALFCAYPAACAEANGDGPTLAHICETHSCVISLTA